MTLGNRLATTLDELEAAKKREAEARDAAQSAKIAKERRALDRLIEDVIAHITAKIEGGMVPHYKVNAYEGQSWIRAARQNKASHQDIWDKLTAWAAEQELEIDLKEEHDGVGIRSWIAITVKPAATASASK